MHLRRPLAFAVIGALGFLLASSLMLEGRGAPQPASAAAAFAPAPCPTLTWTFSDPTFTALPGAKAYFGRYDGGLYRVEIPDNWKGDLVLMAHGYVAATGVDGTLLRAGGAESGATPAEALGGAPGLRKDMIEHGMAWAASSYRCNGYVPGIGLQDTMLLRDVFKGLNGGKAAQKTYLVGVSMGGHITVLGAHQFPEAFDGELALCAAGPGLFDYFAAMGAAAEVVTGVQFSTTDPANTTLAKILAVTGQPSKFTDKGLQMGSIEINTSGGPRPFAVEGLGPYFAVAISGSKLSAPPEIPAPLVSAATNDKTVYGIDTGLGLTAADLNAKVRRSAADPAFRGDSTPYNELKPFDGKISKPLLTMHGTGDMFVPIFLERELKAAVDKAGTSSLLVQRIYRAGGNHCGFSAEETVKSFEDMLAWARGGSKPEGDDVNADLADAGRKFTTPLRPNDPGTLRILPSAVSTPAPAATPPASVATAPPQTPPGPPATGQGNDQVRYDSPSDDRTIPIVFAVVAFLMVGGLTGGGVYRWNRRKR